ncbi:hypothetical protein GQ464_002230 [Rhodocaloribacter litoris]|uniref:hypothetical protein n=1 Tax=Rhodocaloribacter litoris TaxID=2558931 RepID=UPI001422D921|nr:hypothetical protein [Rhodocaloribacter litoris]QXD15787.1 hypothetical protein GQ464_002230 [Rhodocaloribacter litoris]
MSILRAPTRPHGFAVIDRRTLADERLSWAARGLLAYLLSLPDDWQVRPGHLAGRAPCSDYRLRQALAELQACGYARVQRRRRRDGKLAGSTWLIAERPDLLAPDEDGPDEAEPDEAEPDEAEPDDTPAPAKPYRHIRLVAPHAAKKTPFPGDTTTSRYTGNRRSPGPGVSRDSAHSPPLPSIEEQPSIKTAATWPKGRVTRPDRSACGDGIHRPGALLPVPDTPPDHAAAALEKKNLLFLLTSRGVDAPVARRLVERFPAERIRRQVASFDRERPASVGWLVKAIEHDYAPRTTGAAEPELLTYQQMLRWCEANGGLHRTAEFEVVRRPDGTTRFKLAASRGPSAP